MNQLANSRIVVTGGNGFLGREVCRELASRGPAQIFVPRSAEHDLRNRAAIRRLLRDVRPDIVIHLAAVVGGIGANQKYPGRYFYDNAIMGIELLEQSRLAAVKKFVVTGTVCSYPKHTPLPFREEDLWNGYPEETNAPYGLAKKMLLVQTQAYREQYGMNAIALLPVNLYGPGDNFNPETSHVVPALIRKVLEAQENGLHYIEVWGSGVASREFLFVRDAARGIVLATEQYDKADPVNVGSGREISILKLVQLVCDLCEFRGDIRWNTAQPDGQPRRCLDTSRAEREFGFRAATDLTDGLRETIDWYREHRKRATSRRAA